MPLLQLALLALVQGLTEFLPVSSSGHLVLMGNFSGFPDQGQAIDVAVHVGTLGAAVVYFRADLRVALEGVPRLLLGRVDDQGSRLTLCLCIATIPVAVLGLLIKIAGLENALRSTAVIGWTMLIFGIVLWWTDRKGSTNRNDRDWSLRDAWVMGLWQALALVPGTSRSGIAISAGRWLGYDRRSAARLAMLMSVPTIFASGVVLGTEVVAEANVSLARDAVVAAFLAFLAALAALAFMMRFIQVASLFSARFCSGPRTAESSLCPLRLQVFSPNP